MARLPARGAPDPITDQAERELVSRVAPEFWLSGERVLHAGSGVHEQTSEQFGKGAGEGTLFLTTHRIIFRLDRSIGQMAMYVFPKADVDEVKVQRIPIPRTSALRLSVINPQTDRYFETGFYVGRVLAGLIERDWDVTEPFRQPAPGVVYPS